MTRFHANVIYARQPNRDRNGRRGRIVLDGISLPEGTSVTVLAAGSDVAVRLSPAFQTELEPALAAADTDEGISPDELFAQLQQ